MWCVAVRDSGCDGWGGQMCHYSDMSLSRTRLLLTSGHASWANQWIEWCQTIHAYAVTRINRDRGAIPVDITCSTQTDQINYWSLPHWTWWISTTLSHTIAVYRQHIMRCCSCTKQRLPGHRKYLINDARDEEISTLLKSSSSMNKINGLRHGQCSWLIPHHTTYQQIVVDTRRGNITWWIFMNH